MKQTGFKLPGKNIMSWLLVIAMVFTSVIVPTEIVKADGEARAEFYDAALYEGDADGSTLVCNLGEKKIFIQMGKKEDGTFMPVMFPIDGVINGNGRYEVVCQNITDYYLYITNPDNVNYRLRVGGMDESVGEDGYFNFHSTEAGAVVSVQIEADNQGGSGVNPGGEPGGNPGPASDKLSIKLGDDYLCIDNVDQGIHKDGIALIRNGGVVTGVSLNGAYYPEDTLEISGSTSFEVWGVNTFNKISLKRGAGFEMWGRMTFGENVTYESQENIEDCYARLVVWDGIRGEGPNDMARDVRFRDSLIVQVGGKASTNTQGYESANSIGFENIDNIRLYNYDFHDRDATNGYIYSDTTFSNVRSVDIASAKIKVWAATKLCDKGSLSNTTITDFAEGELTVVTNTLGDLVLKNKYYETYPAGKVEDQPDAGEAGSEYVKQEQIATNESKTDHDKKYVYTVDETTNPHTYKLVSEDVILYSVAYVVDPGQAFENTDKGSVTMEGFQKGYYIIDKRDNHFEAWIAAGETVTVKILPEQGYQYTKNTLNINGVSINTAAGDGESEDDIGKYSFVMPTNAGHMCAGFTKTEDVVSVAANIGVTGATINAGSNIKRGNAQFTVEKANPAQEDKNKIMAAENTSGVSYQYLDLKLSEYVVKNYDKDKSAKDQQAWQKNLTELQSNARITLVVDGATSNNEFDVVRLHDGIAEKLDVNYNSATKTVYFDTDKFSTYALVKKTKSSSNSGGNSGSGSSGGSGSGSSGGSSGSSGSGSSTGNKTTVSDNKAVSANTVSGNTTSGNTAVSDNGASDGSTLTTGADSVNSESYTINADNTAAFDGPASKDVEKVTIPSSVVIDGKEYKVTKVSDGAFKNCKQLTKVTIPATVEEIGKNAFAGCSKLKKIVVKKNVETIGAKAFKGCKNLKTLTIKSKKVEKIGKNALKGVPKTATIKVPKAKKTKYEKMLRNAGFKGKVK